MSSQTESRQAESSQTASPETASPETASPETASPETASPETASPQTPAKDESVLFEGLISFLRLCVQCFFLLFHRVKVEGKEHIPASGGVILAPNHQSNYDGPLVGFSVGRPLHIMVAGAYCRAPVLGWVLRTLRAIPIDGPRDRTAYRKTLEVIERGRVAIIFPEGHRSRDGRLMKLQGGAARAALTLGVDIVPVSLLGVHDAWPRHRLLPRLFKPLMVHYHPPIRCRSVPREELKQQIDEVTAELDGILRPPLEAQIPGQRPS